MITLIPKKLNGEITIISSKSLSHRYVLAASLAEGESNIDNILDSDDLIATKKAMISLGAKINDNKIIGKKLEIIDKTIDSNESGSTLRFLIPVAMLLDQAITFTGKGLLPIRTQEIYEKMFTPKYLFDHPKDQWLPLTVKGPLEGGMFHMKGNVSSQFVTGLLYALPLVKNDSKIILDTPLESKGYVDLTLDVLKQFGIKIDYINNEFHIKGNQTYKPVNSKVEGDFSGAAFFVVAGIIGEKITLKGLRKDSLQGDRAIIDIVRQMGGVIHDTKDGYEVIPSQTKGITIDVGQIPDLGPILMILGALSTGVTTITNASRLRIKESDRLDAMIQNLTKLGVKLEVLGDTVKIHGVKMFNEKASVSSFKDHRIAMAMAIASIRSTKEIILDDESVVSKSYPTFFSEFKRLGGEFK